MKLSARELQEIISRDLGKAYRVASSRRAVRPAPADSVTPDVRGGSRRPRAALPEADALDDDLTIVRVRPKRGVADSRGKTISVVISTRSKKVIGEQG
jgi:hypothetical protein